MPDNRLQDIQEDIDFLRSKGQSVGALSDGFRTFNELYAHQFALAITIARVMADRINRTVWISKTKSDGTPVTEGWFILGINTRQGTQLTYELPASYWNECAGFAQQKTKAPEHDGHTQADVLERLKTL